MAAEHIPSSSSEALSPVPHVSDDDTQLLKDLDDLLKERDDIMRLAETMTCEGFEGLFDSISKRLKSITDYRDYQIANINAAFALEQQQAWDEFLDGKRKLREDMLRTAVDNRRRVNSCKGVHVPKKRKRRSSMMERTPKKSRVETSFSDYLMALENQGLLKVTATPDEVNSDLSQILSALENTRTNGMQRPSIDHQRAMDVGARPSVERIHSSRGILHYHDATYEKGDRVTMYAPAKGTNSSKITARYSGTILAVNSKEIHIRSDADDVSHRVYVAHLRNGKIVLKPASSTPTDPNAS